MQIIIDKTSPLPLYVQLAEWLENMIKEERYRSGTKLPSEGKLAQKFQLNRNTIRQAISLLVQKGFVEKQKGVGTFVKEKTPSLAIHQLSRIVSFSDDFNLGNVELEDTIILKEKIVAGKELAEKLDIKPEDYAVKIERVRIANKTPMIFERQFYSFRDFGDLLEIEIKGSMYQILIKHFDIDLNHSTQTFRAINPGKEIARLLKIDMNISCLFLESLAYNSQNICIEVLQSFYRGDKYQFRVETGQYRRQMNLDEIE
ncbi:MAG: GntR family transcriptional regulator [Candidatus Caldatribacteriota bacterium]|nr:GntR family transcriptional regulator [Candidatus Caldatribacteriota bacterium]